VKKDVLEINLGTCISDPSAHASPPV